MELLTLSMDLSVDKIITLLGSDNNRTIISDKKNKLEHQLQAVVETMENTKTVYKL